MDCFLPFRIHFRFGFKYFVLNLCICVGFGLDFELTLNKIFEFRSGIARSKQDSSLWTDRQETLSHVVVCKLVSGVWVKMDKKRE